MESWVRVGRLLLWAGGNGDVDLGGDRHGSGQIRTFIFGGRLLSEFEIRSKERELRFFFGLDD